MDIWYWVSEYGKVFCGYLFLMFLWPSVVFRGHLRKRNKTYCFCFCVTAMIVIVNTTVLFLGLLHMLNQKLIAGIFYGIFIFSLLKNIVVYLDRRYRTIMEAKFPDVRTLHGRYRSVVIFILFFIVCYSYTKRAVHCLSFDYLKRIRKCNWHRVRFRIKEKIWSLGRSVNSVFWKYGIPGIVIIFGMMYFSYGAFQVYSYGAGDLYVHHEWIYKLIEGRIFSGGVYPEAMHCFIYCLNTIFGVRVYSILLFLQGIHVAVFLLSVYFLLRKIFRWQYTSVFVIMLFLCLDLSNADLINSMYRLQMTLPQEFGLHTVFICALYLINYLGSEHTVVRKGKTSKNYWDENLFLFMLALAASIMTHFHVAIMLFIICASFAVFLLKKILNRKYFIPLVFASFCACLIAVVPMMGALAQGIPFNGSINWAIKAMSGDEGRGLRYQEEQAGDDESDEKDEIKDIKKNAVGNISNILPKIYKEGYVALYGGARALFFLCCAVLAICVCVLGKRERFRSLGEVCSEYPAVILASGLFALVYAAPMIGLPDVIPEGRFFAPGHMMVLAVAAMPVDLVLFYLSRSYNRFILRIISLLTVIGIYGITNIFGCFRGYLFYQITRYNAAASVTESIINTFPKHSYTIVSPTDELYPVIQYGWHEELLKFVEDCEKEEYSILSEYVFLYVEKRSLSYGQSHFLQGPAWFGKEKYLTPYWNTYYKRYPGCVASQSPEIAATQVSEELAEGDIPVYSNAWLMYSQADKRAVLESKLYTWCQHFAEKYPSALNIYYEDDDFVCYYFRQNAGDPPYDLVY